MENQPTINIGMIGSVSNGKSSITEKLTGIKTQKYASEKERNITIKLGYANAKIYKCLECDPPDCYQSCQSEIYNLNCKFCDQKMILMKHISIVDNPGHSALMATMLNGSSVMDYSILVESAANSEIALQTKEHLIATNLVGLKNKIVCMNKMDLVKKDIGLEKIKKLQNYLQEIEVTKDSLIVPIVANYGINVDVLCQYICEHIPEPSRDIESSLKMIVVRSFNVNKQEINIEDLQGGVIGGTILRGKVMKNSYVTVYPGLVLPNEDSDKETKWTYTPITSKVISINSEKNNLEYAIPGGLIGIQLDIDPGLTVKDGLVGNIVTFFGENQAKLKVFETIFIEFILLDKTLNTNEIIMINCNSNNTKGKVIKIRKNKMEISLLENPMCLEIGDYITISQMTDKNMSIIGRGKVLDGISSFEKL
ncbi:eukaryotic translation initiation factor 2 gamma subunit [Indivirus ILV1]|uniref:protein-synthesizing GTPase n=1 Tax=Indivirus ILV1 TaxID=1977633 RepID=A0A1V0SDG4_9VIRU|nr:eukaryotic translation initiation factor 2 gamma subunit [Indivirus ILV1]